MMIATVLGMYCLALESSSQFDLPSGLNYSKSTLEIRVPGDTSAHPSAVVFSIQSSEITSNAC